MVGVIMHWDNPIKVKPEVKQDLANLCEILANQWGVKKVSYPMAIEYLLYKELQEK
tara:strand:- start:2606 stop:2773 length:168 start_codon:yes stop_codon:yes gene_type:complete